MFQIVDVVPAIIGNVFARAVAHEWQVSNSLHQNGNGQMISQNGNSTAVSNSVSSSKGMSTFKIKFDIVCYQDVGLYHCNIIHSNFSCQRF